MHKLMWLKKTPHSLTFFGWAENINFSNYLTIDGTTKDAAYFSLNLYGPCMESYSSYNPHKKRIFCDVASFFSGI